MKIVLVTETFPPEVNGVAMTNQRLVRGLVARGHAVTLVKPSRKDADPNDAGGATVLPVWALPIPTYPGLRCGIPRPGQLKRAFREIKPDVVHVATEGPLGVAALRAARKQGIPVTSTFHTNFQDYCADYGFRFLEKRAMAYLRWFHNACAFTTVPDPALIERLGAAGVQNLRLLGRGADTKLFDPARRDPILREEWGAAPGDPVALYVGRAAAEKNIPLALEAWKAAAQKCPTLKMVVVGDGPVRKKLQKRWPGVIFAGMRYDEDLARHYASADLFLFGSTSETFGNVIVEALASGLVVLTYDYAAGQQFIKSGENGFLAPLADEKKLRQMAVDLVQNQPQWSPIREKARTTAESYPWTKTIETFEGMLSGATP
jgi:glycosyltransferase involved in cell wall biosynthesis